MSDWITNQIKTEMINKLKTAHVGKSRVITGKDLTLYLNRHYPEVDQRTVRSIIRELRRDGQPICSAAGLGYFWPACLEDVEECKAVEFDAKAKDMLVTSKAMFEGAVRMFGGQRSLSL